MTGIHGLPKIVVVRLMIGHEFVGQVTWGDHHFKEFRFDDIVCDEDDVASQWYRKARPNPRPDLCDTLARRSGIFL